jgi:hypothetical protein
MRNVVLHLPMSLDGCVGSDGERSGVAIPEGDEVAQWELERVSSAGAHLKGRVSSQEVPSYWPQSLDQYAAPMNDVPDVVFSRTPSDAEPHLAGDPGRAALARRGAPARGQVMRTLHVGLRVADLDSSIAFSTSLGSEVLGQVPATELGTSAMLELPGDEFVSLTDPDGHRIDFVQWPDGHPTGMTGSDLADPGQDR